MLTLLIGKDWVSNSDAIFEMLKNDVSDEKSGRILLVPEMVSHDTERRLCAIAGDTTSRFAEVLTFTRLAKRVSDSLGVKLEDCLDNGGRIVAMAAATRQLHSKLKVYAAVESRPELLEALIEAVDEFKRCCINSSDLKMASERAEGIFAQKLEELSLILSSYDGLCQRGKKDPCDQMTWLLEELESCDFAKDHVFYIDGFPDFTKQHLDILMHLIKESPNVVISLNCDSPGSNKMAFEKAGETANEIIRAAKDNGISVNIREIPARNDELATVRERLFQGNLDNVTKNDRLNVYCTDTIYQECLAAADEIQNKIISGARYRDIAVVCNDLATYGDKLQMVLDKCQIPAYFSGTEPILGRTVIATILSALDSALGGFDTEDVLRYLKSSLSPISMEQCDVIENYVNLWGISGNAWKNPWKYHPLGLGFDWDENSQRELETIEQARKLVVEPLLALHSAFNAADHLGQQVIALYDFIHKIQLAERLEILASELEEQGENRDAQILNQLWDIIITALEQMHDVLVETQWNKDNFTRLFKILLSQYDVGTIPTVLDAVTVGNASTMRCHRVKHLIVIGAQEGMLPGYGGITGLLSDRERTQLRSMGIPLSGGSLDGLKAEFAEIYGVFCSATETITVSYPTGKPSFVCNRLQILSGKPERKKAVPVAGDALEIGAYFAKMNSPESAEDLGIKEQYSYIKNCISYDFGQISEENISALYGNNLRLSASQVDKLADCRFHYFLRYGLRANERKPATVDPAEFGTYVHAVLENTAREIHEMGGFKMISEQETLRIADKHSKAYIKNRFDQLDDQRINYLFNRNTQELSLIVQELWDELRDSKFEPAGFEVSFGDGGEMPAIDCSGSKMRAQLRGFVDRVDIWNQGENRYFRVVDYKTGKKDFDYCDVFNGLGLQMLLYLFALEDSGENLLPAGVQYFPARVPLIATESNITDDMLQSLRGKDWKRKGLLLNDEDVLAAMTSEDGQYRMPYTVKRDGTVSGDVATNKQFIMLKKYVFMVLSRLVDDIASGNVEPNPYTRGGSHDACAFCPYTSVCHNLTVAERRNYKAMSAQNFWDCVEKEVENNG